MPCRKLASLDVMSKSDPMVVVFQQSGKSWIEVGRTEALENQTDASFVTAIEMDYLFEVTQHLLIVVYDVDDPKKLSDLSKQQKIGQVQVWQAGHVMVCVLTGCCVLVHYGGHCQCGISLYQAPAVTGCPWSRSWRVSYMKKN